MTKSDELLNFSSCNVSGGCYIIMVARHAHITRHRTGNITYISIIIGTGGPPILTKQRVELLLRCGNTTHVLWVLASSDQEAYDYKHVVASVTRSCVFTARISHLLVPKLC